MLEVTLDNQYFLLGVLAVLSLAPLSSEIWGWNMKSGPQGWPILIVFSMLCMILIIEGVVRVMYQDFGGSGSAVLGVLIGAAAGLITGLLLAKLCQMVQRRWKII